MAGRATTTKRKTGSNSARGKQEHALPAKTRCREILAKMMLIRRFEERAGEMYAKAKIGGFLHLCIGEEAAIVGATNALEETDYLMSTYREHGQAIARGTPPEAVMAELFGKQDGCSGGRGGSMHLFDYERRCVLFIAAADPDAKQVLLTFSVARTPQGMPVLVVATPPGVTADDGVTVTAGAAEAMKLPIQSCSPQRCRAIAELTSSLRAALESADVTSVTYVRADSKQSTYNLPTRGFKDGLVAWFAGSEPRAPIAAAVN